MNREEVYMKTPYNLVVHKIYKVDIYYRLLSTSMNDSLPQINTKRLLNVFIITDLYQFLLTSISIASNFGCKEFRKFGYKLFRPIS